MSDPDFVLAGTYQQHVDYCRRRGLDPRTVRYVSRPDVLLGTRDARVVRTGTWRSRTDVWGLGGILDALKTVQAVVTDD